MDDKKYSISEGEHLNHVQVNVARVQPFSVYKMKNIARGYTFQLYIEFCQKQPNWHDRSFQLQLNIIPRVTSNPLRSSLIWEN